MHAFLCDLFNCMCGYVSEQGVRDRERDKRAAGRTDGRTQTARERERKQKAR